MEGRQGGSRGLRTGLLTAAPGSAQHEIKPGDCPRGGVLPAHEQLRVKDPATLPDALHARGWPAVGGRERRVMAILHQDETYRVPCVAAHPALDGRAMFTNAPPGSPDAGLAVVDDPVADGARIAALVAQRYIVRTRADADGAHGPQGLEAALACGAQIVSTDFPPSYPAADGYRASFAHGAMLEARP